MTRQEFNHQLAQYKYNVRSSSGIVTMNSGIKCYVPSAKFYGACAQDGTPTPDNPIPVTCNNAVWRLCGKNLFNDALLAEWGCNKMGNIWTVPDSNLLLRKTFYTNSNNDKSRVAIQYKINCLGNASPFYLVVKYTDGNESIFRTDYSTELKYASGVSSNNKTINHITSTYGSRGNNFQIADLQFEYGSAPTAYEPYHNGGTVDLSLLPDGGLYGIGDVRDEWDAATGKGIRRCGIISSYAGEEVGENWISSTGELSEGATVVYQLAEPVPFTATPQPIIEQNGYNQLLQESGDIADTNAEVTFIAHS